jgi:hypothetical protein
MSNAILTPTAVTRESLRVLHAESGMIPHVTRSYDDQFAASGGSAGGKIGPSLKIRKPNKYTVRSGKPINVQDTTEDSVTLTVSTQKGVDMTFDSSELTLSIQDFSKRFITPAVSALAADIDSDLFSLYKDVYNLVGSPGTVPNTALVYLQAGQYLNESLCPMSGRVVAFNPAAQANTVDALKGLFAPGDKIGKQYAKGEMGEALGFKFVMSQNVRAHTCGTRDNTTPLTNAVTAQTGSSLIIDGLDASVTITVGDVFTIDGVYMVHPETKESLGRLQQFVVTAAETADGSGNATLEISPSIIASGATQNMAFHPEAFALATADLILPKGVHFAGREVYDGVSMRVIQAYDINNDVMPCRIDILYGKVTLDAAKACRITA